MHQLPKLVFWLPKGLLGHQQGPSSTELIAFFRRGIPKISEKAIMDVIIPNVFELNFIGRFILTNSKIKLLLIF